MTIANIFNLVALLVTLATVFGYVNHRWLRLPHTIGLVVIALTVSICLLVVDAIVPALGIETTVRLTLIDIDFEDVLMKGILSFLLFAGALHVDLEALLKHRWAISTLATVGIVISTVVVATLMHFGFSALGLHLPFGQCLVFGALISPTDPIAVMSILKKINVPQSLEAKIAGESLLNDGVGVVLFTVLVALTTGGEHSLTLTGALNLFLLEAIGGVAFGLATGYLAYSTMKAIDDYHLEILVTLSLVMGTYSIASFLHVSGPLAVVIAGLFIGNQGKRFAMSESTRQHVDTFWIMIDEILNSLLFLAIGFEIVAITITGSIISAIALTVPIVLLARLVAVAGPITTLGLRQEFSRGVIPILTWGGLRGGISVALALSLPENPHKPLLLAITYGVVIFSIVVQGLTLERVVRATTRA